MDTLFSSIGVIALVAVLVIIAVYSCSKKKGNVKLPFPFKLDGTKGKTSDGKTILPPVLYFKLERTGQVYEVSNIPREAGVTVGREHPSDIIVKSDYFSSKHFVIGVEDEGMFINVDDHAHTQSNGIRLSSDLTAPKIASSIPVTNGLALYIGLDKLTFFLPGASEGGEARTVSESRTVRRT